MGNANTTNEDISKIFHSFDVEQTGVLNLREILKFVFSFLSFFLSFVDLFVIFISLFKRRKKRKKKKKNLQNKNFKTKKKSI